MRIVNPSYGVSAASNDVMAGRALDWMSDPIALFHNSKPNARELLDGVKTRLSAIRSVDNIGVVGKPSASQPAPADTIGQVVQKYRAALLALGD
jgi:hypothetical protein